MSWWGKILGGIFGYLVDGPVTALIGALLGHAVDSLGNLSRKQSHVTKQRRQQNSAYAARATFFSSTFSVMGHICKADGYISQDEIQVATETMERMELSRSQREKAIKLFNEGKSANFPLTKVLEKLRDACLSQKNLLRMFLEVQIAAAFADGELSSVEQRLLRQISERLGILRMEYERIEDRVRVEMNASNGGTQRESIGDRTHSEKTINDAYTILGLKKDVGDRELKKAYRKLLSQHHPDKLVSKGLPEEMMKMATEKTHEIRQAYEIICTARGL